MDKSNLTIMWNFNTKWTLQFFSENILLPATTCIFHRCEAARLAALGRGCSEAEAEAAAEAVAEAIAEAAGVYYDYEVYIFPIFIR